jgi:hypothetical protein
MLWPFLFLLLKSGEYGLIKAVVEKQIHKFTFSELFAWIRTNFAITGVSPIRSQKKLYVISIE